MIEPNGDEKCDCSDVCFKSSNKKTTESSHRDALLCVVWL